MAYCTPAQLILRYDARRCYDLCSDTGEPVAAVDFPTNDIALAILEDATADLKMAVRRGNKYSLAQLEALFQDAASISPAQREYQIIRLVADLAFGRLNGRRGLATEEVFKLAPFYKQALEMLELLSKGERIFDDIAGLVAEAGVHVANIDPSPNISLWSRDAQRFFGDPNC